MTVTWWGGGPNITYSISECHCVAGVIHLAGLSLSVWPQLTSVVRGASPRGLIMAIPIMISRCSFLNAPLKRTARLFAECQSNLWWSLLNRFCPTRRSPRPPPTPFLWPVMLITPALVLLRFDLFFGVLVRWKGPVIPCYLGTNVLAHLDEIRGSGGGKRDDEGWQNRCHWYAYDDIIIAQTSMMTRMQFVRAAAASVGNGFHSLLLFFKCLQRWRVLSELLRESFSFLTKTKAFRFDRFFKKNIPSKFQIYDCFDHI